ncbi:WLM-domain-containing protein [Epithele typhae]|uniref:WLM-domain-containing protein n=1 Tax=Epithele typhae TaxID=378194 RepID=UPI002007809B|nr:WLM-domain-containing protein [Epithele typhae]KAH9945164.1 WLM-domain-containing protein [Epithele typhae]
MAHARFNEREANPNPHIKFITPLKMVDSQAEEDARQLLRALAAQVRPIMKSEGFLVNSFEEYEHNHVFAGRNWNNGETVELVLRRANGSFLPIPWLLGTLCHELAHIKHMNHGPAFQALWRKLRNDVGDLQRKGYYGDGYWSSGSRLSDSAVIRGEGLNADELPEYVCGGAQGRRRPTSVRRRRRACDTGPSNHTGAQTAKRRKAGARVTAQGLFVGSGRALDEGAETEDAKQSGAGFRKKAASKRAREERARAAEHRLSALRDQSDADHPSAAAAEGGSDLEDDGDEDIQETDQDRRRVLLEAADTSELDALKAWQLDYSSDFILPSADLPAPGPSARGNDSTNKGRKAQLGPDNIKQPLDGSAGRPAIAQDIQTHGAASNPAAHSQNARPPARRPPAGLQLTQISPPLPNSGNKRTPQGGSAHSFQTAPAAAGGLRGFAQAEIATRKREGLGMGPGARRTLGAPPSNSNPDAGSRQRTLEDVVRQGGTLGRHGPSVSNATDEDSAEGAWPCGVCTLVNEPAHLACAACATPRGESEWTGRAV